MPPSHTSIIEYRASLGHKINHKFTKPSGEFCNLKHPVFGNIRGVRSIRQIEKGTVYMYIRTVWQYGLWSFQAGGTKLERFLHKNQKTQRKSLNFEFWINSDLSKIGHYFSK